MFNLIEFTDQFKDEKECKDYLASARCGDAPVCQHCGHIGASTITSRGIYKCKACRKQFTERMGTIFEESRLPLRKWFMAIYIFSSLKKGISSVQVAKYVGVGESTAWFMRQRIRYAMGNDSFDFPDDSDIGLDETYMGGKKKGGKRGRGSDNKTPVFGIVAKKGKAKAIVIENISRKQTEPLPIASVKKGERIMTDEFHLYKNLTELGYKHETVAHGKKEWVRGDITINHVESIWSHLKRGIYAIYLQVSRKHLQKYCDEFMYRHNSREMSDFERFEKWFGFCAGRLTYKKLIS